MADMSPDEMAALQEQSGIAPKEGGITKLVKEIGTGLSQLAEVIENSPKATDEDRATIGQILQMFVELIERKLANAQPGENPPSDEDAISQPIPANAGPKGVPVGPGM